MATISQQLEALLGREGGYTNHPADKGGPTNWGITEQTARSYGYKGPMIALPRDTALQIYLQRYWIRPGFADISKRLPTLAEELMDTGVNMGQETAAKFLQRALNVLNQQGKDFNDIKVDGDIGPTTLYVMDKFITKRGKAAAEKALLRIVDSLQGARYVELAERSPSQEAFLFGWVSNRVGGF